MFQPRKCASMLQACYQKGFFSFAALLLFTGVVAAQELPTTTSMPPALSLPAPMGVPLRVAFPPGSFAKADDAVPPIGSLGGQAYSGGATLAPISDNALPSVRRITLEQAQEAVSGANNPLVRLGQLSVEAAKQHRQGVQGLYFPNVGVQFENLHLNKQTGQVLTVPVIGTSVPVNIFAKNQTVFNIAAVQPVTPLLSVYQLVKIARADENIARAKAGMPLTETTRKVEKNFFELLVAQRELISAEAEAKKIQAKWLTASEPPKPGVSAEQEADMIGTEKAVALSSGKVKELTASLNEMLRLPEETTLELVPPEPLVEDTSLVEATEKATAANTEVVEAEQTAIKARAGLALTKLTYIPTVAIAGGYANQNAISDRVLPKDFSYIGVIATFTLFDGFKREHGVKEVKAQAEMADLGVQLTKAKVAAGVKSSYLELNRSRKLYQLTRRMVSAGRVVDASYRSDNPEIKSAQARMEADMFRAELEYRQAYARLKSLTGGK
jgi:outer membrane protein TolC